MADVVGLQKGLQDPRGNIFFQCRDYIDSQRPECFILENVLGLAQMDNGALLDSMIEILAFCYQTSVQSFKYLS